MALCSPNISLSISSPINLSGSASSPPSPAPVNDPNDPPSSSPSSPPPYPSPSPISSSAAQSLASNASLTLSMPALSPNSFLALTSKSTNSNPHSLHISSQTSTSSSNLGCRLCGMPTARHTPSQAYPHPFTIPWTARRTSRMRARSPSDEGLRKHLTRLRGEVGG
ncbi:unnamed protein product [Tuber aestivum]|uniref:Uncharacterized protein n=1 Tax=Tuber aestivum TaxID=59557 RepID=A0A292PVF6_9PEZI|nr:unnamed protein product [Tuber aestivum]